MGLRSKLNFVQRNKKFDHDPIDLGYTSLGDASTATRRYYATPEGNVYPSITTVLGAKPSTYLDEWRQRVGDYEANRVCHHAATRGSALHETVERYLNNEDEFIAPNTMPNVVGLFKAIQKPLDGHVNNIRKQEFPLYSDALKLAGRVDLIANYNGVLSIIDFKTSVRRKKAEDIQSYFEQATAYSLMFEERSGIRINQIVIVIAIDNDPVPQVFVECPGNWTQHLSQSIDIYNNEVHTSK